MKKDPIENTEEFKDAMEIIQPQLDLLSQKLDSQGLYMGSCHVYWARKKELLKELGIDWKTPQECNPYTMFD